MYAYYKIDVKPDIIATLAINDGIANFFIFLIKDNGINIISVNIIYNFFIIANMNIITNNMIQLCTNKYNLTYTETNLC